MIVLQKPRKNDLRGSHASQRGVGALDYVSVCKFQDLNTVFVPRGLWFLGTSARVGV